MGLFSRTNPPQPHDTRDFHCEYSTASRAEADPCVVCPVCVPSKTQQAVADKAATGTEGEPPAQNHTGDWQLTWSIDLDSSDAATPRDAARQIWTSVFGRGEPGPDDACVFAVVAPDGTHHLIDLAQSEEDDDGPL